MVNGALFSTFQKLIHQMFDPQQNRDLGLYQR